MIHSGAFSLHKKIERVVLFPLQENTFPGPETISLQTFQN